MTHPELGQIESAFSVEFPVQRLPPSENAPVGQLAVTLDADKLGRERTLYLLLQPPSGAEDVCNLQFFALLPFAAQNGRADSLARVILLINNAIPLVGFGLDEPVGKVYFRCVLPMPRDHALSPDQCLYVAWLIFSCLDHFSDTLEAVASGNMEYTQAQAAVQKTLADIHDQAAQ